MDVTNLKLKDRFNECFTCIKHNTNEHMNCQITYWTDRDSSYQYISNFNQMIKLLPYGNYKTLP